MLKHFYMFLFLGRDNGFQLSSANIDSGFRQNVENELKKMYPEINAFAFGRNDFYPRNKNLTLEIADSLYVNCILDMNDSSEIYANPTEFKKKLYEIMSFNNDIKFALSLADPDKIYGAMNIIIYENNTSPMMRRHANSGKRITYINKMIDDEKSINFYVID
jgi:hypothetical protein